MGEACCKNTGSVERNQDKSKKVFNKVADFGTL
jgi:hypothetical protein